MAAIPLEFIVALRQSSVALAVITHNRQEISVELQVKRDDIPQLMHANKFLTQLVCSPAMLYLSVILGLMVEMFVSLKPLQNIFMSDDYAEISGV